MDDTFNNLRKHSVPKLVFAQRLAAGGALETHADGALVTLSDGRRALDFGSYGVNLLGHRHPVVVAGVHAQLATLPTSTRVLANHASAELIESLLARFGQERLRRVWLGLNGSDVVEAALKLARLATGRPRIIAVDGAFHGKTLGALSVTHTSTHRRGLQDLLVNVTHIPLSSSALGKELEHGDVAGLIVEPIQGEGGVRPIPPSLMANWSEKLRSAGAFLICDEIQVGLHRCGPFSLSLEVCAPDAVLFGKQLGGGVVPLSALVTTDELFAPLLEDPFIHTSTFSGHPLCAAAGTAALRALDVLSENAEPIATSLNAFLEGLRRDFPSLITGVRGRGLLWGIDCASPAVAGHVLTEFLDRGLLVSPCLGRPEVIRLLPPLVITEAQLSRAHGIIHEAFIRVQRLI